MQDLKISLITVVYNGQNTIGKCIESVLKQDFKNIQYIIIDGGSTDDTAHIIVKYKEKVHCIISEPDHGVMML
jgi:glycosyltransferase involved in cell wall biosynthesis